MCVCVCVCGCVRARTGRSARTSGSHVGHTKRSRRRRRRNERDGHLLIDVATISGRRISNVGGGGVLIKLRCHWSLPPPAAAAAAAAAIRRVPLAPPSSARCASSPRSECARACVCECVCDKFFSFGPSFASLCAPFTSLSSSHSPLLACPLSACSSHHHSACPLGHQRHRKGRGRRMEGTGGGRRRKKRGSGGGDGTFSSSFLSASLLVRLFIGRCSCRRIRRTVAPCLPLLSRRRGQRRRADRREPGAANRSSSLLFLLLLFHSLFRFSLLPPFRLFRGAHGSGALRSAAVLPFCCCCFFFRFGHFFRYFGGAAAAAAAPRVRRRSPSVRRCAAILVAPSLPSLLPGFPRRRVWYFWLLLRRRRRFLRSAAGRSVVLSMFIGRPVVGAAANALGRFCLAGAVL